MKIFKSIRKFSKKSLVIDNPYTLEKINEIPFMPIDEI